MTSVEIVKDAASGKRRARLGIVVLPEPRLGVFQHQYPRLAGAKDAKPDPRFSTNADRDIDNDWITCWPEYAIFTGVNWAPLLDAEVDDNAPAIGKCTLQFMTRQVKTTDEIRFRNVKALAKPATETKGGRTYILESLECTAKSYRARIRVKGKGLSPWNAGRGKIFQHRIERNGKVLQKGEVNNYGMLLEVEKAGDDAVMRFGQGEDFYPREPWQDVITNGDFKDDFDIVLTAPGETVERALEFEFKDIALPK